MLDTILTTILTTPILLSSFFLSPEVVKTPYAFTTYLPQNGVVGYTARDGESLQTVSQVYYGSGEYWTNLNDDNPWIVDPEHLKAGDRIVVSVDKSKEPRSVDSLHAKVNEKEPAKQVPSVMPTGLPTKAVTVPAAPSSYDSVYQAAGASYGVPWEVLYGLHMTESGGRNGPISSGRGPQGPMQFMPGTWKAYGVDGDGDGVADINNAVDAIHGAANYLAKHGSLDSGLRSYGGNTVRTLKLARAKGYSQ